MSQSNLHNRICLSISQLTELTAEWIMRVDWIEFRLDLLENRDLEALIRRFPEKNFIATCRKSDQSDNYRLQRIVRSIQDGCRLVDLDIYTDGDIYNELIEYQQDKTTEIISSYHNFEETPSYSALKSILNEMNQYHPKMKKIATHIKNPVDLEVIQSLYPDANLIAFGMGELGMSSRTDCLRWGAPFSYVYPDDSHPTAAGQLSYSQFLTQIGHGF